MSRQKVDVKVAQSFSSLKNVLCDFNTFDFVFWNMHSDEVQFVCCGDDKLRIAKINPASEKSYGRKNKPQAKPQGDKQHKVNFDFVGGQVFRDDIKNAQSRDKQQRLVYVTQEGFWGRLYNFWVDLFWGKAEE